MKILISAIVIITGLFLAFMTYSLYGEFRVYKDMKEDYAQINKIDYGLFNVQQWKVMARDVFSDEITKFQISPSAYGEVEVELRKYLHGVYDKYIANGAIFDQIIADAEKDGKVNKMILKLIKDNIKDQIGKLNIQTYIPNMASQLAVELKKNEPRLRDIMQSELTKLLQFDEKYPVQDPRMFIYEKYGKTDLSTTNDFLRTSISQQKIDFDTRLKMIFAAFMALILFLLICYKLIGINHLISLMSFVSLILLAIGISFPMIDIDARLNSFVFNLFDKDLSFGEQNIFYQSKSILGVTRTLIEGNGIDLKIVGYMVLCFSVVFPIIKLILSAFFLNSARLQRSKLAKNIIFYLGKWSMADVFVVALFMAYIGFFGLIDSQLNAIEQNKGGFAIETVNYTHLGPGALFFTTYCILSIVTGLLINKKVNA